MNGLEKYPKLRFKGFLEPWHEIVIGDLFKVTRGYVLPTTAVKGKPQDEYVFPVYSSQTKDEGLMGYYNQYLYENAITWTTDGANAGTVHFRDGKFYCTNVCGVLLNEDGNANRCIAEILGSISKKYVSYVGNPKLMNNVMSEIRIHIPSVAEQKKIDELISALDLRIVKQRELIEHLKKYKRGLHRRVFSPKPHWAVKPLRDIASFCGGGTPSKDVSTYWQGNIGWISSSDVQEDWIDEISISRRITEEAIANSATKLCPKGTIAIISRVGVGKVAIMPENLCTSQDYTNITTIDGDITFFAYQIAHKMKIEASKTQGTAIKGVTSDTIKSMEMDIPNLEEQRKISTTLQKFDYRIKNEIHFLTLLQNAKRSLLQQLFI